MATTKRPTNSSPRAKSRGSRKKAKPVPPKNAVYPKASKATTPPSKRRRIPKKHALVVQAMDNLEAAIGGRTALVDALGAAELTEEQASLFGLIADPRNDHFPLGKLCGRAGFTLPQLLRLFKNATLARAQIIAIQKVAKGVPQVAGDVMTLATIRTETCRACQGTRQLEMTNPDTGEVTLTPCPVCDGAGEFTLYPDHKSQELALELAGLYKKSGGINIGFGIANQNINAPQTPTDPLTVADIQKIRKASDKLLFPGATQPQPTETKGDVVDAEIVAPEAPGGTGGTDDADDRGDEAKGPNNNSTYQGAPGAQEIQKPEEPAPPVAPAAAKGPKVLPFLPPPGRP